MSTWHGTRDRPARRPPARRRRSSATRSRRRLRSRLRRARSRRHRSAGSEARRGSGPVALPRRHFADPTLASHPQPHQGASCHEAAPPWDKRLLVWWRVRPVELVGRAGPKRRLSSPVRRERFRSVVRRSSRCSRMGAHLPTRSRPPLTSSTSKLRRTAGWLIRSGSVTRSSDDLGPLRSRRARRSGNRRQATNSRGLGPASTCRPGGC